MSAVRINLIGEFQCLDSEGHTVDISRAKEQALITILALSQGYVCPRSKIIDLLWSDRGDEQARASLRQSLWSLKKTLGDCSNGVLQIDRKHIGLKPELVNTDVGEFCELIGSPDNEALEKAVSMYQADLLEGLVIQDRQWEEWLSLERETLRVNLSEILCTLINGYIVETDIVKLIDVGRRLTELDPFREEGHRALMLGYAENNQKALALRQYERCRELLHRELETDPSPETQNLFSRIKDGESAASVGKDEASVRSDPAADITTSEQRLELPDKPSIAVLPFINMSDDPEQEYFSDGITEDITTALSHFSGLFVIARNSSFAYKGQPVDAKQVAKELGVRYLLEGSVRRMGKRIRINGQLIDATSGSHIWAERFDGDVDDIFELQDEITRKIVGSIAPRIELAEVDRSRGLLPTNLSSYELSLKAKAQWYDALRSGEADGVERAIDTAQDALSQDARNTHALWVLAFAHIEQYLYRWSSDPEDALRRGTLAADMLIQVDPSNANGHCARAAAHLFYNEFDLAIAGYDRALSLNPNSVINLFMAAWGESLAGLSTIAREHAELGLRLSPRELDMWLGVAYLAFTQASFSEGDFEDAMKWGRLAIQMHTKAPIRRALMVACCAYTGNLKEAAHHTEELQIFSPDFIPSIFRGELMLYKNSDHNKVLVDGLRKAGVVV